MFLPFWRENSNYLQKMKLNYNHFLAQKFKSFPQKIKITFMSFLAQKFKLLKMNLILIIKTPSGVKTVM